MLQVAFAGHNRPHDLGRRASVSKGLDGAFRLMREAGVSQARLLTGLAPGADELAAAAWRRAGLGPIHAVLPFLDEAADRAVGPGGVAESATWLDGAATEAEGRNAHLKQTRLLIETADLLVVVWTGEQARGAGGTADAVRLALEKAIPVLWIRPSDAGRLQIIRPDQLPLDFHFPEFQEGLQDASLAHVEPASAKTLRHYLGLDAPPPAPPAPRPEPSGLLHALDKWLGSWLWKTHGKFRLLIGGKVTGVAEPVPTPPDLAEQPGYQLLTRAFESADGDANQLSAVHRSEQVLLILAMLAAAFIGSSPAVWPNLKLVAVALELVLAMAVLVVWSSANQTRQHERWGERRYLAELLRLERAGWALGVSLLGSRLGPLATGEGAAARQIRRDAGLPHGRYDQDRVRRWGAWALSELVQGQSSYHRASSVRDSRIAHRIHIVEDASFVGLLVILVAFLAIQIALKSVGLKLPYAAGGFVLMASVVIPAMAAASMALEAKLEFKEQSSRSKRIAERLDDLAARVGPNPTFDQLQGLARSAMQLHISEAGHWLDGAGRRQLFRP